MSVLCIASQDTRVHLLAVSDLGPELTPATHLSRLRGEDGNSPLPAMLGHPGLDMNGVEVFEVEDVRGLGLPAYLGEAYDIPPEALASDVARLRALEGTVVVLTPRALGRMPLTLDLPPSLTLIGAWHPAQADNAPRPTPDVDLSPAPTQTTPAKQGAMRLPGWLFVALLLVAAFAFWLVLT